MSEKDVEEIDDLPTKTTSSEDIRSLITGNIDKYSLWTDYISALQHEINSSKSGTTNFRPNELHLITPPRSVADVPDADVDAKLKNAKADILMEDLRTRGTMPAVPSQSLNELKQNTRMCRDQARTIRSRGSSPTQVQQEIQSPRLPSG